MPPVVQVHFQVAHKHMHFMTMIETQVQPEKDNKYGWHKVFID